MNLQKQTYFNTPVYFLEKKEWLDYLINSTDNYIEEARNKNKQYFINNKDFGLTHHSMYLDRDSNFENFNKFICNNAKDILDEQGFNMDVYSILISELWVQEFSKEGGGNHTLHIHSNSHISGFYFLKCSDKTSYPIFHDPRLNKKMIQLKEKNDTKITDSSEKFYVKPIPGLFVFFNSYLEHEFVVDHGIEPFRFIHFNLQAISKELVNNQVKRI